MDQTAGFQLTNIAGVMKEKNCSMKMAQNVPLLCFVADYLRFPKVPLLTRRQCLGRFLGKIGRDPSCSRVQPTRC